MKKTIGQLCDELCISNIRIWFAEDIKRNPNATDAEVAKAARITNTTNGFRNELIQAIDEEINELIISGKPQKLYKITKLHKKQ